MQRSITTTAFLLALALAQVAGAQCETSTWFQADLIEVTCPLTPSELADITVPLEPDHFSATPEGSNRLQTLQGKSSEVALDIDYISPDLEDGRVKVDAGDVVINPGQISVTLKSKAMKSLKLILPPNSLFCGTELVEEETVLDIPLSCIPAQGDEESRPLDWRIDAAPADDDAEDDPGLAVTFSFDKAWGYNLNIADTLDSWSSNIWRLKVDGNGVTNDADFHDSVTADLSWSWNRTFLDLGDKPFKKRFTSTWASLFARPETTFEDDHRDYVFGARIEALANLQNLIGTNVGTGTRPYLALGFETVDPDKREDGTVPDNYERATADFLWKFSPFERVRVEVDWEAKYIVDKDDLTLLGLDDRLQDKLDLSVALDVSGQREFMPFLKYTRGAEAPAFEVVEEILFGLVWDRLFQGEAPQ